MNMEDFSLFKLRSTIFLINFPLSFTLAIISIWFKIMPESPSTAENYTREEIEQIAAVKNSIREFCKNLNGHVENLLEYLEMIRSEKPFKQNYSQIIRNQHFQAFKSTMLRTKGTSLVPVRVDELFITTYEKMSESIDNTIGNTIEILQTKIKELNELNLPS